MNDLDRGLLETMGVHYSRATVPPCSVSDPPKDNGVQLDTMGVDHHEGLKAPGWRTGVTEARREEIRVFLKERFGAHHEDVVADEVRWLKSMLHIVESLAKDHCTSHF